MNFLIILQQITPYSILAEGFSLAVSIFMYYCLWKQYVKAGEPGWKCLIPFYGSYISFKIITGNGWKFLIGFIPIVGWIYAIYVATFKKARVYGHGTGFGFGLLFLGLIFNAILAFNSSVYLGPEY